MERRKTKSSITKLCVFLLAVWMFVQTDISVLADSGSLTISLKDLQSEYSSFGGVEFTIYKVGTISDSGYPKIAMNLFAGDYPETAGELDSLAKELAAIVTAEQSEVKPMKTMKTDGNGKGAFAGLDEGVYLICSAENNPYGKISPFLVQLPYYVEVEGSMTGPVYDAEITPKASVVVPEPEKDPDSTPEQKPGTTTNTSTSNNNNTGNIALPAENMTSPKTGDAASVTGWFIPAAATVMGCFLLVSKREEEKAS